MHSQFFYPTVSGSLGEARRLGFGKTLVKRELDDRASQSSGQPFERVVRSEPTTLIAEESDDGLHSDTTLATVMSHAF